MRHNAALTTIVAWYGEADVEGETCGGRLDSYVAVWLVAAEDRSELLLERIERRDWLGFDVGAGAEISVAEEIGEVARDGEGELDDGCW